MAPAGSSLVWSAGCSTRRRALHAGHGAERIRAKATPAFGSACWPPISAPRCWTRPGMGIFKSEVVEPVPPNLRRKYLMRSRDPSSDLVRVVPELRAQIEFRRLNFMDADFGLAEPPEIIFCRNVIIYFDRPTQVRLLEEAHPAARARRVFLRRSLRVAAKHGPAAGSGRAGRLQEVPMMHWRRLPEVNRPARANSIWREAR